LLETTVLGLPLTEVEEETFVTAPGRLMRVRVSPMTPGDTPVP